MKLYTIRNWDKVYENNRTRDMKHMAWVPIPNNHDSDGYTLMVSRKDGAAFYGAWVALIQVASKCDPRGTLLRRTGEPHNSTSLSRITRIPEKVFDELFFIAENECKWLASSESHNPAGSCGEGVLVGAGRCLEQNRTEQNGIEQKHTESDVCFPEQVHSTFRKPTLEAVRLCCAQSGIPDCDADWFWNKCEGNGWTNNGKPIKSWPHVLSSWKAANYLPSQRPISVAGGSSQQKSQETLLDKELRAIKRRTESL